LVQLAGLALLDLIDAEAAEWLASIAARRHYRDGETIHIRDDPARMGIIIAGRIRMVRQRSDGSRLFVSEVAAGQHYADILMFEDRIGRTHDAIAVGEVTIDHYDKAAFDKALTRPDIVLVLYRITAGRLIGAMTMADDLRSLSPEEHLAKVLLHLRTRDANARVENSQEELAALLGISTMTLANALGLLKREGLVKTGYRCIQLPDPAALRHWLAARIAE
jgi:CRP-like cAMP-binding protein